MLGRIKNTETNIAPYMPRRRISSHNIITAVVVATVVVAAVAVCLIL